MAKRVTTGSSGTGFAFAVVQVKEIHADRDLCVVEDLNTANQQDLCISKRGETAWPQVGDLWLIDRSAGHWMLQIKVTDAKPPSMTGTYSTMDPDLFRLVSLLSGLGLVTDATTAGSLPVVTGSKNVITPVVQSILSILDARGILDDQTTAQTLPVDTWVTPTLAAGWTPFTSLTAPRYKLNYDNTVTIEGRAIPPGGVVAGDLVFTLDVGYQPPTSKYFTAMVANSAVGNLIFSADRSVRIWDFGATTVTRLLMNARYSLLP
jgi:uncharacterized membrane protein